MAITPVIYLVWTRHGTTKFLVSACTTYDDAERVLADDRATCAAYWGEGRMASFDWVITDIPADTVVEDIDDRVENAHPITRTP